MVPSLLLVSGDQFEHLKVGAFSDEGVGAPSQLSGQAQEGQARIRVLNACSVFQAAHGLEMFPNPEECGVSAVFRLHGATPRLVTHQ